MKSLDYIINGNEYKFRITTKAQVEIEKKIGPLLNCVERIVEGEVMATLVWGALLTLNHGITLDKAYTIVDEMIDDGLIDTAEKRIEFVMNLLENAGFLSQEQVSGAQEIMKK